MQTITGNRNSTKRQVSVLDKIVSVFDNCNKPDNPQKVNLLQWLNDDTYAVALSDIRSVVGNAEVYKRRKASELPAATISAVCSYRGSEYVERRTGLLSFDIDLKENKHIANYTELREQLSRIKNVAYCARSCSGKGFWGIVPIVHPEYHEQHFLALQKDFESIGIVLDGVPKNVASLRIYSYDPEAFYRHDATPYAKLHEPRTSTIPRTHYANTGATADTVESAVQYIESIQIDLTGTYEQWVLLGFALANEFGEGGRDYFHRVSQFHTEYKETEADTKYNNILRHENGKTRIGTFFHLCKEHGVPIGKKTSDVRGYDYPTKPTKVTGLPPGHKLESFTNRVTGRTVTNEINQHGYPALWDN